MKTPFLLGAFIITLWFNYMDSLAFVREEALFQSNRVSRENHRSRCMGGKMEATSAAAT